MGRVEEGGEPDQGNGEPVHRPVHQAVNQTTDPGTSQPGDEDLTVAQVDPVNGGFGHPAEGGDGSGDPKGLRVLLVGLDGDGLDGGPL